jgi:inhibitor of KinA sporulation pathway (predicted exonuclease)
MNNESMNLPPYLLVIDLEATCDETPTIPRHEREIIEIGAVLVRSHDLCTESEFQTFVRPVVHPTLTPFCTRLTSIRQADVEHAPTFPTAIASLAKFIEGRDALFCSWGDYDRNQLELDAARHRTALPFRERHLNLKWLFRGRGVGDAFRRCGLTFEGTPHRGIDDARNIARLLPWILGLRAA